MRAPRQLSGAVSVAAVAALLPALVFAPADVVAQEDVHADPTLQEWEVPYPESRPRDPYVGPDGRVFFVGQRTGYVAALDPESGEFQQWDLGEGAGPHNLIVDDDGIVWYAGNRRAHVGQLDPATGDITQHAMPDERARDPHTLVWDGDGDIWFTVQGGNLVGHLDRETGESRLVEMPEVEGRRGMGTSRPYGIKMDSRNRPWIALFGTNSIAMVDPETLEPTYYELPEGTRPRRLVVDSRDRVWYVDYAQGELGLLNTDDGSVEEWPLPGGPDSRPYGMAIDASDRIWLVETGEQPNHFVGYDPATGQFFSRVPVDSGAGTIRHMYYHEPTNSIWFGTDVNTVGKAALPPLRRAASQ